MEACGAWNVLNDADEGFFVVMPCRHVDVDPLDTWLVRIGQI